jgi:hypothetical protein
VENNPKPSVDHAAWVVVRTIVGAVSLSVLTGVLDHVFRIRLTTHDYYGFTFIYTMIAGALLGSGTMFTVVLREAKTFTTGLIGFVVGVFCMFTPAVLGGWLPITIQDLTTGSFGQILPFFWSLCLIFLGCWLLYKGSKS